MRRALEAITIPERAGSRESALKATAGAGSLRCWDAMPVSPQEGLGDGDGGCC